MKCHHRIPGFALLGLGLLLGFDQALTAQTPAPALDTRPAFMQMVTNRVARTNAVIVTNYVVVTTEVVTTNYYNAQGILLQPVSPAASGLIPIPATPASAKPAVAATPTPTPAPAPDPQVVKSNQLVAVRDVLLQSLGVASNQVVVAGAFTTNTQNQIQIPQGLTSFDRRKSASLVTAMNGTAEKAASGVVAVLARAASQFQTQDPAALLKGGEDAVTRAFVGTFQGGLDGQVLGVVQQAGTETKLRETYNSVMLKGGGLLGAVLGSGPAVDIDAHVAQGVLQTVVQSMVAQEKKIRKEPSARITPALKQAFP